MHACTSAHHALININLILLLVSNVKWDVRISGVLIGGHMVLIGIVGVTILLIFLAVMLYYSPPHKRMRRQRELSDDDNDEEITNQELRENLQNRYQNLKDYYLTYLECCYGAFIAIFIGIIAVPVLPLQNLILKVISVFGFWLVGGYYLVQIVYTYGQLKVVYGLLDIDDTISHEVEKLGFPFNLLEKIFRLARQPVYEGANIKYFGIGLGYLGLLGISIIACL